MLAMTETIKDINNSTQSTPFPYQYRGGNRNIISYSDRIRYGFFFIVLSQHDKTTHHNHRTAAVP